MKKLDKVLSQKMEYDTCRIEALDGIRAVAILLVVWFHFWQQSWLIPVAGRFNLDWLVRHGSLAVDLMILLSGFCLFLPHARNMVYGEKLITPGQFYKKRFARIAPVYYISIVIILVFFAIPEGGYSSLTMMMQDIVPHLFFVHNWFNVSMQMTQLNGALWTVGVIVQFYLVFPLLAKAFRKKPLLTYCCMTGVGLLVCNYISSNTDTISLSMHVNNTLTFLPVYANGMLGAYMYIYMTKNHKPNKVSGRFCTVVSIACIWMYKILCDHRQASPEQQQWQLEYRYLLSLVFLIFVMSTIMSTGWYQKIWDNVVMRFLATISFNLYICHQYIAVKLKQYQIPPWSGGEEGWMNDQVWKWKYMLLCIGISIVVAVIMTYIVEKPLAKLILKEKKVR